VLAKVEVLILVPQDREARLGEFGVATDQFGNLTGFRVLVRQGEQWHVHADQLTDVGPPEAGAGHDDVGGYYAVIGGDSGDLAAGVLDTDYLGRPLEHRAAGFCPPGERNDDTGGLGESVGLDVQAAEDPLLVEKRVELRTFGGVEDAAVDTPGGGPALFTVQVRESLFGGGDLESTELAEAPFAVDVKAHELLDGVSSQFSHRLGRVGLEHEARCVRRRAAGQWQRPLVEDGDLVPAPSCELVGQVRADDAGSDDHYAR
jgi:hypothetical protein